MIRIFDIILIIYFFNDDDHSKKCNYLSIFVLMMFERFQYAIFIVDVNHLFENDFKNNRDCIFMYEKYSIFAYNENDFDAL